MTQTNKDIIDKGNRKAKPDCKVSPFRYIEKNYKHCEIDILPT